MKYYVLANNYYAYMDFLRRYKLSRFEWRYIVPGDMQRLIGLRNDYYIVLGSDMMNYAIGSYTVEQIWFISRLGRGNIFIGDDEFEADRRSYYKG